MSGPVTETEPHANAQALYQELDWLSAVVQQAVACYLRQDGYEALAGIIEPPEHDPEASLYGRHVRDWRLERAERLALALALAPHLRPEVLDIFFGVNGMTGRSYSEFGGVVERQFSGFLPTGQTLVFLLGTDPPQARIQALRVLSPHHRFATERLLGLERADERVPPMAGSLSLSDPWLQYWLTGEQVRPELSASFPATPIETPLGWDDLVLDRNVLAQVEDIRAWLVHGHTLMEEWALAGKVKPGYRTVFHGPPGTGKTLTAALLGKSSGREVYRVDLSMVVSKYIGETEKNLGKVFDVASHKDWILFFDEADALFGKRTAASTSNDRHANQQTGYLLQRIEDFPGTVILATNLKANMDEAFTRRFQSMIHFNMPSPVQRLQLWRNAFDGVCELDADVDLAHLAHAHELAGGAIINVLRHCALAAIQRGSRRVRRSDLIEGIKRELRKDNKTLQVAGSQTR